MVEPAVPHQAYPHLFAPWRTGPMPIGNRIVMGAMHTGIERLDRPEERIAAFYRARAEGGVGLIITGGVSPNAAGRMDPAAPWLAPGRDSGWHRAIADSVRGTDTRICMQLLHAGRYARHEACVGASARQARINRFAPAALSTEEVWQTVEDFASAAELAHGFGYHGVEIMGSEGYLINQFTAQATNDRSDEFGGSLENRARLACEIVAALRKRLPEDFLIIYRISALDLVPDGMTGEETRQLAAMIQSAGATILNTGIGWHESIVPTIAATVPRAAWSYAVRNVRDAVTIPVIASNRINNPDDAERILSSGIADFVSLARPLLADPAFANKAEAGRSDRIAPCIACNQACLDRALRDMRVSCMVNPVAGHEIDLVIAPAAVRKRIAVVGGGAAGMALAFTAAARGHSVNLFESGSRLGGQLLMAREVPGKSEFNELLRYFEQRLLDEGVTVHLDHVCSPEELTKADFDEIIIATGVTPRVLDIPGSDDPRVVNYVDVLRGNKPVGSRVAIIGAGGIAFDVATYLLGETNEPAGIDEFAQEYGLDLSLKAPGGLGTKTAPPPALRQITLMHRKHSRPSGIPGAVSTSWIHRAALQRAGVNFLGGVSYRRIAPEGLVIEIEGQEQVIAADTIIICAGQEAERSLYDALINVRATPRVHVIGGADRAGELDAVRAIDQATRLALEL